MRFLNALVLAFIMPLAGANAALIEIDSRFGPLTAVHETESGLDWLKLSVTQNTSINEVFAEMRPAGKFEGFRYASTAEFTGGLVPRNLPTCSVCNEAEFAAIRAFHATFLGPGALVVGGFFAVDPPEVDPRGRNGIGSISLLLPNGEHLIDSQGLFLSEQTLNRPNAHWLVKNSQDIPEPKTAALLALGLLALAIQHLKGRKPLPEKNR
jgi:hypothetical protein